MMRRAACKAANPLKIRASLGLSIPASFKITLRSQSLKDQGKSRTGFIKICNGLPESQSLKDQGKSRTWNSGENETWA